MTQRSNMDIIMWTVCSKWKVYLSGEKKTEFILHSIKSSKAFFPQMKICTFIFEWQLFAFQFCFVFLQAGAMNLCDAKDALASARLTSKRQTFLLAGEIFHSTKVHIIKVSVITHLHVQIPTWALGSWSDQDVDWMFLVVDAGLVLFESPAVNALRL